MKTNMGLCVIIGLIVFVSAMAIFNANILKKQDISASITGGAGMTDRIPSELSTEECTQIQQEIDSLFDKESLNDSEKARLEELVKKEKYC